MSRSAAGLRLNTPRCVAGVFAFGLFATDIFVNAGQVVTGGLAPYFLSVCRPNYTSADCRFNHQFVANGNICTGTPAVVERARRSFPSKDAALSVYSAVYVTVSNRVDEGNGASPDPTRLIRTLVPPDVRHQHHQDQVQPPGQARPLSGDALLSVPRRPQPGLGVPEPLLRRGGRVHPGLCRGPLPGNEQRSKVRGGLLPPQSWLPLAVAVRGSEPVQLDWLWSRGWSSTLLGVSAGSGDQLMVHRDL